MATCMQLSTKEVQQGLRPTIPDPLCDRGMIHSVGRLVSVYQWDTGPPVSDVGFVGRWLAPNRGRGGRREVEMGSLVATMPEWKASVGANSETFQAR